MEVKHIKCPCCNKEVDIPLREYSTGFDFNYSILINSVKEFFDLVDICPECGYVMLFDNGISEEMINFVNSPDYQALVNNHEVDEGLKKWYLYACLCEVDEKYTEAGIAYTKAYDYMELKNMEVNKKFIEKAASNFLSAAGEYTSFIDAILAIDALRRDGEMESAQRMCNSVREMFNGDLVDKLLWEEEMWIHLNTTEKRYLEI